MTEKHERVKAMLIRRHLGKRGIHGIKVDEASQSVELYVDEDADLQRAVAPVRKDSGDLRVRALRSRRASLA
jgi:hypothetical protein